MEPLNADQLLDLATTWVATAHALNAYQVRHWADFSVKQHLDMNAYQSTLLNFAQDLETQSVTVLFAEAESTLTSIKQATTQAEATLKTIKTLTTALSIGAIIVALAASIARSSASGIELALSELSELLIPKT